ncbi:MAG: alcohol dehydrogenase catalytic domain-containing protein [Candidatus Aegiribacteria sp.]|nr:alcohol dehydrogenase catalytic domain-containing protein [Candidatus Aegiribacteria sp.]
MKAMVLSELCDIRENPNPLSLEYSPVPEPAPNDVLLCVLACGVCHTELDEIEGRTAPPFLPVIPGHEVVGRIVKIGDDVITRQVGERVGVGWFYSSCGSCSYCLMGNENLCSEFKATGRDADGGYAEFMKVPEGSAFPIPAYLSDTGAAPLLCAGAIGYRSLRLSGIKNGDSLGLTGFGGSAHLVLKMVRFRYPDTEVFVFARNPGEREFARELGASWAGDTAEECPIRLRSIIDTTPAWKPVMEALKNLAPEGRLVINAIRKEDNDREYLLRINYPEHLWMEKEIKSVANVSRRDIAGFLELADEMRIQPEIEEYLLEDANLALSELRMGNVRGAKVLVMN